MEKRKKWQLFLGLILMLLGIGAAALTRTAALAEVAGYAAIFAVCLIAAIVGLVTTVAGLLPQAQKAGTHTLALAAMFAALCYVGFTFFQIKIPVGDSSTSFHLGNVFCVLAALCIGGLWGGLAGSVGMTIGDLLDPVYITSAPKTFVLKLGIGLITGLVAHKIFKLSREKERKVPLAAATAISVSAGMAFNIVADPLVGYFYKMYVLGVPQDAATILAKMSAVTTSVNAVIAVIAATIFYLALRPALKKINKLPQL